MNSPTPLQLWAQHCHSHYSKDGESSLSEVVGKAKKRGLSVLFLTEHAEDLTPESWEHFKKECLSLSQGIFVIPGLEFRTSEGLHILGLGLQDYHPNGTCLDACAFIRSQNGFSIIAHPNYYPMLLEPPCFDFNQVDAIEIWTAKADTQRCPRKSIIALYQRLKKQYPQLRAIAGLDAHGTYMMSTPVLQVRTASLEPLLDLLRNREYLLTDGTVLLDPQGEILRGKWRITFFSPLFRIKKGLQRIAKKWRKSGLPELNSIRKLFRKVF